MASTTPPLPDHLLTGRRLGRKPTVADRAQLIDLYDRMSELGSCQ